METTVTDIIKYSLDTFSVAICIKVQDKIILLNPSVLQEVSLETLANHLYQSEVSDDDIISALEVFENARKNTKVPLTNETKSK